MCCGGGVLTDMFANTPLHPSQEGNRTNPGFKMQLFQYFQSPNISKLNKLIYLIVNKTNGIFFVQETISVKLTFHIGNVQF